MALIIWKPRAIRQLNAIIDYGVPEFGMVAFNRLDKRIQEIIYRLEQFPESFPPEPLLINNYILFRSCILRKRHKIIYHLYFFLASKPLYSSMASKQGQDLWTLGKSR